MTCNACDHKDRRINELHIKVVALQESLEQLTKNMRRVDDTYVISLLETFGPGRSARLAALLQEVDNRSAVQKAPRSIQARNRTVATAKSCNDT